MGAAGRARVPVNICALLTEMKRLAKRADPCLREPHLTSARTAIPATTLTPTRFAKPTGVLRDNSVHVKLVESSLLVPSLTNARPVIRATSLPPMRVAKNRLLGQVQLNLQSLTTPSS